MRILEVIENLVKNTKDSIVHIEVASDLQRHAKRSSPKVIAEKANSIIKTIPDSFALRVNRAIWNQYDMDWNGKDYNQHRERVKEEIKQTVSEFLDQFDEGWRVFDYLNGILSHYQKCGIQAQPDDFLHSLSATDCKLSIEICKHIISHSSSPLAIYISSLLVGIREKSQTKAIELTKLAVETKNKSLCSSIAQGYAPKGGDSSIETDKFLGYCSSRIPEAVVDFLLERLDIAEEKKKTSDGEFQPLPYLGFHQGLKDISSSPNYKDFLRRVRDRALNPTAIDYFWLPKLFAELSDGFSSVCFKIIQGK
jgi:hypothetical protein